MREIDDDVVTGMVFDSIDEIEPARVRFEEDALGVGRVRVEHIVDAGVALVGIDREERCGQAEEPIGERASDHALPEPAFITGEDGNHGLVSFRGCRRAAVRRSRRPRLALLRRVRVPVVWARG